MTDKTTYPPLFQTARIDWVDFAKGVCIILVVLMHSVHGVEKALSLETAFHGFIDWARPFRMPDFFLIAGLFLSRRIGHSWRSYLDRKVLHFAYFYLIWMTIWWALKLPENIANDGLGEALMLYPLSLVQPLGTLWFIYMLPVFFVVTKLTRQVPVVVVWLFAVGIHTLSPETGLRVVDEFASRFVFFYSGYAFAAYVFQLADKFSQQKTATLINALTVWATINAWLVFAGWGETPVVELVLGFVGAAAIVMVAVLLARIEAARFIAYCGANSIVIFVSYFVFMAATRVALLRVGADFNAELLAIFVTFAAIASPLITAKIIAHSPLRYIYERHPAIHVDRLFPEAERSNEKEGKAATERHESSLSNTL